MDTEWDLHPLVCGETGQSYMGIKNQEKIFLKRNATPFLAAVSAEGVAPRMLWTKRSVHGEILIAQEWIEGRELTASEMVEYDVLELVRHVHHSKPLLNMLNRIQSERFMPSAFIAEYECDLQYDLQTHRFLTDVLDYLKLKAPLVEDSPKVVCHGDLNCCNFIVDKSNRIYLVDWEMAKIADPLSDIASFLCQYVSRKDWLVWLDVYGMPVDKTVMQRLEWYSLHHCLMSIKKCQFQGQNRQMNQSILMIKDILGKNRLV